MVYSTYLAAINDMAGQAIQVDANGNAYIAGSDLQFSLTNPIEQYSGNGDIVVAEIDATASTQLMATFLGGSGLDTCANSLALDLQGAVYVTGDTQSPDFPVTQDAFQTSFGGQNDVFVAKISPVSASSVVMAPSSLLFAAQPIGTSSDPQTIVLRSVGSMPLAISKTTIIGDFTETDDCEDNVAPASFCTFSITFTPTTPGLQAGALVLTDDAQGNPHWVSLSGSGVEHSGLNQP